LCRNRTSTTFGRKAIFDGAWINDLDVKWISVSAAWLTADANFVLKIDSGVISDRFGLATGGRIENTTTELREIMRLPGHGCQVPARSVQATPAGRGDFRVIVSGRMRLNVGIGGAQFDAMG